MGLGPKGVVIDLMLMMESDSNHSSESIEEGEELLATSTQNETPKKRQHSHSFTSVKKFLFGLVIVCIIACTWVGSTQTAKSAYTGDFKAPFFSMWFGTSWMMVLFPLSAPLFYLTKQGGMKDLWR